MNKSKIYPSYAKVNLFLKITGLRGSYHEIASRFLRVDSLCDTMWFDRGNGKTFEIIGSFDCSREENTIFKAYRALIEYMPRKEILEFCKLNRIMVHKQIPSRAGLGGGSSNAATFLKMINEALSLGLTLDELAKIGAEAGADVPFFVYDYSSANVTGIGEIVENFNEPPLRVQVYTPDIECGTAEVYQTYRKYYYAPSALQSTKAEKWLEEKSAKLFMTLDPEDANDLFSPALKHYPELHHIRKKGWFFSGSGSSFFKIMDIA